MGTVSDCLLERGVFNCNGNGGKVSAKTVETFIFRNKFLEGIDGILAFRIEETKIYRWRRAISIWEAFI